MAWHPVKYDERLRAFYNKLDDTWSKILAPRDEVISGMANQSVDRYRLLRDRDKIGFTVVRRSVSPANTGNLHVPLSQTDMAKLKGQVQEEISRLGMRRPPWRLRLVGAVPVKPAVRNPGGVYALVPHPEDEVVGFIDAEKTVIEDEILSRFGVRSRDDAVDPEAPFVPELHVARIHAGVEAEQVENSVDALNTMLAKKPLIVTVQGMGYLAQQRMS